jgi:glucokinase
MSTSVVAAFDVGGTSVKAALLDETLRPVATRRQATAHDDTGTALVAQLDKLVAEMSAGAGDVRVEAVGVVVPGVVDEEAGLVRFASNLGWRNVPLPSLLRDRLGVPVGFGHDVSAGGLAEARIGAARDVGSAVFTSVGTGIAAAILLNGMPYRGRGYAGELGHVDIGHGLPCPCGARGCVEAVASARSIAARYSERSGYAVSGALEVVRAWTAGDAHAAEVVDEALSGLARGLRIVTTLLAPEVIVLGGGLFESGPLLLDPLARRLTDSLTFQRPPQLRRAELGDEAGCLGAGLLARDAR